MYVYAARYEMHVISTQAAKQQIESETGSQQEPGLLQRWFPGWMSGYQGQHNQQPGEVKMERAKVYGQCESVVITCNKQIETFCLV